MRLWDLEGGQVIRRFTGLAVNGGVAYSPADRGRTALVGLDDGAIVLDLQTGQEIRRFPSPQAVDSRSLLAGWADRAHRP